MKLKLSTLAENERGHATVHVGDGNPRANSFKERKKRGREREGGQERAKKEEAISLDIWQWGQNVSILR